MKDAPKPHIVPTCNGYWRATGAGLVSNSASASGACRGWYSQYQHQRRHHTKREVARCLANDRAYRAYAWSANQP